MKRGQVEDCLRIVKKLAWSFSRTTPHDFEELERVGIHAYRVARSKWDPNKGTKITSWVYTCVQNALIKYCKRYDTPMEFKEDMAGAAPEESDLVDRITELSDLAWEVVAIVLDDDGTIVHNNGHITRMRLSKFLREERNCTNQDIALVFREIQRQVCCG